MLLDQIRLGITLLKTEVYTICTGQSNGTLPKAEEYSLDARYTEDGVLRGHLDKPWGLDYLNGTTYGITGSVSHCVK